MKHIFQNRLSERPKYESPGGKRCPEIWELADGSIAVIGNDITTNVSLPEEVILGKEERIVVIPRDVLAAATVKFKK